MAAAKTGFIEMEPTVAKTEHEVSYFRILSLEQFGELGRLLPPPTHYTCFMKTKLSENYTKRIGYAKCLSTGKILGYSNYKTRSVKEPMFVIRPEPHTFTAAPIICFITSSFEGPQPNDVELEPLSSVIVRAEERIIDGVRYRLGSFDEPSEGLQCYFFQIEQEHPTRIGSELAREMVSKWKWLFDVPDFVPYATIPFATPKQFFKHGPEICLPLKPLTYGDMDVRLLEKYPHDKIKIDGVSVQAIYDGAWSYKGKDPRIQECLDKLPPLANHWQLQFEFVLIKHVPTLILTDVVFARNSGEFRNNLYHQSSYIKKSKQATIPVSLQDSKRLLEILHGQGFVTNLANKSKILDSCPVDGLLQIDGPDYVKIKPHQTIELWCDENKTLYTAQDIFIAYDYTIVNSDCLSVPGIYEFVVCVKQKTLTVINRRFDKKIADKLDKVYAILNNAVA